jgi:hypothetical protein
VKDKRLTAGIAVKGEDLADDDDVIAGDVHAGQAAVKPAGHPVENRCARRPRAMGTPLKAAKPRGRLGEANRLDSHSCSALRTLTAKTRLPAIARHVDDAAFRHTSTSGGASETDVNAFAVTPAGGSSPAEVTIVTPVANVRSTPLSISGASWEKSDGPGQRGRR